MCKRTFREGSLETQIPRFPPASILLNENNLFKINKKAKLSSISGDVNHTPRTAPMVLELASNGVLGHRIIKLEKISKSESSH